MLSNQIAERIVETEEQKEVRRKAESITAAKAAEVENIYIQFEALHTGTRGLYSSGNTLGDVDNLIYACEANKQILVGYCEKHFDDGVTLQNLEKAFLALRPEHGLTGALAPITSDPTKNSGVDRKHPNGNARNMFPDQIQKPRAMTQATVLPFTKRDLLDMSQKDFPRFKALIARHGSAALNAILLKEEE